MDDETWGVAEAKAHFSEVLEKAEREGPQHITKHGRRRFVVVSETDWNNRQRPRKSLVDVLLDPKIRGLLSDEEMKVFERDRGPGRPPPEF